MVELERAPEAAPVGSLMPAKQFVLIVLLTLTVSVPGGAGQEPDPHDGQPAYCVNHGGFTDFPMEEPHICRAMCDRNCGDEGHQEKRGCLTYCRPDHCHCIAEDCDRAHHE